MLSKIKIIWHQMVGLLLNNKLDRVWKEHKNVLTWGTILIYVMEEMGGQKKSQILQTSNVGYPEC